MWYVVQTMTNEEELFKKLYETVNDDTGYRLFIPTIILKKHYHKEWHSVKKVMFPGYVFVETDDIEEFAKNVTGTYCFSKLLKAGDEITPVSKEEKEFLESMMDDDYCVNYSQGFIVGEDVVITEGALRNQSALIRKVDRHRRIAVLDVKMFGRMTPVEVGFGAFARVSEEEWESCRKENIERYEQENNSSQENNVRVISGVFTGMTGQLLSLDTAKNECFIELELFGTPTKVAFGRDEVKLIS